MQEKKETKKGTERRVSGVAPRLEDRQKDCPEISSLASSVDSGSEVNPNLVWLWEALVSLLSLELAFMGTPAGRRPEVNGAGQGVLWLEAFRQQA